MKYEKVLRKHQHLRELWGNKNTQLHELETAYLKFCETAFYCNDERTDNLLEVTRFEYSLRAPYFLKNINPFSEQQKLVANISRFPQGKHYYVTIHGDGVDYQEKRNTVEEAERLMKYQVRKFKKRGFLIEFKSSRDF